MEVQTLGTGKEMRVTKERDKECMITNRNVDYLHCWGGRKSSLGAAVDIKLLII